jgi:hypothetical protein
MFIVYCIFLNPFQQHRVLSTREKHQKTTDSAETGDPYLHFSITHMAVMNRITN